MQILVTTLLWMVILVSVRKKSVKLSLNQLFGTT